jgi:hypothetical protein
MTHTPLPNDLAPYLKSLICHILNWDELEYAGLQFQCGCLYLQYYISKDPAAIDEVLLHPHYWNWWKSEWFDRDYVLAGTLMKCDKLSIKEKRLLYRKWHDARVLADECSPVGSIMSNGYKTMISELIKSEVL